VDLNEYSKWTDNVAVYPKIHEPHYLALGIAEELGELLRTKNDEELIAEAGDVLWYGARYARIVLDADFAQICTHDLEDYVMSGYEILQPLSIIAGVEKKRLRDGDEWDDAKKLAKHHAAAQALAQIMQFVIRCCAESAGKPVEDVLDANVAKLTGRKSAGTIQGDGDKR
jgi:MazG nucleotide pyrophosphohydrolase domain